MAEIIEFQPRSSVPLEVRSWPDGESHDNSRDLREILANYAASRELESETRAAKIKARLRPYKEAHERASKKYHAAEKALQDLRRGYGKRPSFHFDGPKYAGIKLDEAAHKIVELVPAGFGHEELALIEAMHDFYRVRKAYYALQAEHKKMLNIDRLRSTWRATYDAFRDAAEALGVDPYDYVN